MRLRVIAGWILAIAFILMSGRSFVENSEFTTESWGYLLLTPLALALALSPTVPWESNDSGRTEEWSNDEGSDEGEKDVPDPIESGFDIPVL
ncbi:MAG: hypothetical protein QF354_04080 [Candidatus Thalassarchaeum sp.]|nr:hypothetical protein [Candidatus Thalassarchaeum sp.]